MEKVTHTPTPWKIGAINNDPRRGVVGETAIINSSAYCVAVAIPRGQHGDLAPEITRANAEFIVRAVNCHEELVQALTHIASLSAGWDADGSLGPKPPLSWESVARLSMDLARAALAKAEGKQSAAPV